MAILKREYRITASGSAVAAKAAAASWLVVAGAAGAGSTFAGAVDAVSS
jgi:hypothetical protein